MRIALWILAAWLLLFFLSGLAMIPVFPPVNYNVGEEIWAMDSSVDFLHGRYGQDFLTLPQGYFLSLGSFLLVFGKTVYAARAFSLVAATAGLYLVYRLGKELANEEVGVWASLIVGSNYMFSWYSRTARHEMLTVVLVLAGLLLLVIASSRDKKNWLLFYSGLAMTLSVHANAHNIQYVFGLLALYFVIFRREILSPASLYFSGGLFSGFLVWIGSLALFYFQYGAANLTGGYPIPALRHGFAATAIHAVRNMPQDYIMYLLKNFHDIYPSKISIHYYFSLALAVYAVSLITGYRRVVLQVFCFIVAGMFSLYFFAYKLGHYHYVEYVPFMSLALALGIRGIGERLRRLPEFRSKKWSGPLATWMLVLLFAVPGIVDVSLSYADMRNYRYERLLGRLSEAVPPDQKVLGIELYKPAFGDEDFISPWFQIEGMGSKNCIPFRIIALQDGVKYVLLDSVLRYLALEACGREYENDMFRFLVTESETVAIIDEPYPNVLAANDTIKNVIVIRLPH